MKDHPSLDKSLRYKKFIEDRDKALENISHRYSASLSLVMDALIDHTMTVIAAMAHKNPSSIYKPVAEYQKLETLFQVAADASIDLALRLRKSTYILSYAGEAEAIGQALGQKKKANISKTDLIDLERTPLIHGGDLSAKVSLYYNRLKRKVQNALDLGIVLEEPLESLERRVKKAFPDLKTYKKPTRNLRSLKEADEPEWLRQARIQAEKDAPDPTQTTELSDEPQVDMSTGIIPDDDWQAMVSDYKDTYLPESSFSRTAVDYTDIDGVRKYDWELEQEITNDFVKTVRDGQSDAANENGITDMMWISVSHKTLCPSCEWRDGLTSTEIEEKLDGEHKDDDIDVSVPPAHLNCYCRVAPVTKELLDAAPNDSKSKEFEEWLTS